MFGRFWLAKDFLAFRPKPIKGLVDEYKASSDQNPTFMFSNPFEAFGNCPIQFIGHTESAILILSIGGFAMKINAFSFLVIGALICSSAALAKDKDTAKRTVASSGQHITCGDFTFSPPAKMGDLPAMDFEYPVKVTQFSFRDGNLMLVAMDQSDNTRLRVLISAQVNAKSKTYIGQFYRDDGGNELQLNNGPITCTVK